MLQRPEGRVWDIMRSESAAPWADIGARLFYLGEQLFPGCTHLRERSVAVGLWLDHCRVRGRA